MITHTVFQDILRANDSWCKDIGPQFPSLFGTGQGATSAL